MVTRHIVGMLQAVPVLLLCAFLKIYRAVLSPALPPSCRFSPSCSHYAEESLRKYGLLRGGVRSLYRLLRCSPWSRGGIDPP